jgi:hypothetical protein
MSSSKVVVTENLVYNLIFYLKNFIRYNQYAEPFLSTVESKYSVILIPPVSLFTLDFD